MKRYVFVLTLSFIVGFMLTTIIVNYSAAIQGYSKANQEYMLAPDKEQLEKPSKSEAMKFKKEYFVPSNQRMAALATVGGVGLCMLMFFKLAEGDKKERNRHIEGKDRWATRKEIVNNNDFYLVDSNNIENAKRTGPVIARLGNKYVVDTSTTHSLIIGTTRSGKTQTYVLPMLRLMCAGKDKQSFVVNDPKGELLEHCYKMLKDNNYNVVVLNLKQTDRTSLWNPLTFIIQKYRQARDNNLDLSKVNDYIDIMAEVLTQNEQSDPIWPASAKSLLTAMILYLMEVGYETDTLDKVNMYSVYQFFIEYGQTEYEVVGNQQVETSKLDKIFQALPRGNPAKSAYATSNFARGDMKSSIYATLSENISLWGKDSGIASLTSGDDIDFIKLFSAEQPCAIFMVVPDNRPARHCLATMFINQVNLALNEYLEDNDISTLPRTVNFILDEFGNMVTIPDMATKITISASRGILFHMFVQDLNQLELKYSKSSKTIQSNCGNLIYIYSLDMDTNKYFSSILGTETLVYSTYSGKEGEGLTNQSQQYKAHPLMSPTDLSVLKYGETIIKRQRMYPIKTRMPFFYKLGIKKTKLKDIPLSEQNRKLADWVFPFEIVDKKNGFVSYAKSNPNDTVQPVMSKPKSDIPDFKLQSPDSFAEQQQKRRPASVSPIKASIRRANELTNNEFANLLGERNFKELTALLNQLRFKQQIDSTTHTLLQNYIEGQKNDR